MGDIVKGAEERKKIKIKSAKKTNLKNQEVKNQIN